MTIQIDCGRHSHPAGVLDPIIVRRIAGEFSADLRRTVGVDALDDINDSNMAEGIGSPICASHDRCDANMCMDHAFNVVIGRSPNGDSDADADLWNAAWIEAKRVGFML